jgi:hypothetical protein
MTEKSWIERHGLSYALLRLQQDFRPAFIRAIGLHGDARMFLGDCSQEPPPRLRYKRSLGSHVAPPRAGEYLEQQENRYDAYFREMLAIFKESLRNS